jgi:hypothetical protein
MKCEWTVKLMNKGGPPLRLQSERSVAQSAQTARSVKEGAPKDIPAANKTSRRRSVCDPRCRILTWKNLGRSVNAGAKDLRILAPMVGVRRQKDKEAEKDITKQNERVLLGFRNAYVVERSSRDLRPRLYALDATRGPKLRASFDSSSYIIAQFFGPAQRCFRGKLSAFLPTNTWF